MQILVEKKGQSVYPRRVMRGTRISWVAGVLLLGSVWAVSARADIYMYRDTRGGLHFSNAPAEPQYQYYMSELQSWKVGRWGRGGRIDGARRKAYDKLISEVARRHHVDTALVKAVIRAESDFVPHAVSPKGALGLMQLMPQTARMHGVWHVLEPRDNVEGGVSHLRYLLDRYNGNLRLVLAAYNAGEKAVEKHGGVPPYPETQDYVASVLRFRDSYLSEQ
jgi:soluble lytic murein transglycosylase-like protein